MSLSLAFVILSHCGGDKVLDLIRHVDGQMNEGDELIVVRHDMDVAEAKNLEKLPILNEIRFLDVRGSFNYSRFVNYAVESVECSHVVLLNDDLDLDNPKLAQSIRLGLELPECGVLGVTLSYPNGLIQHIGVTSRLGTLPTHKLRGEHSMGEFLRRNPLAYQVPAVTFACAAFSTHDFRKLNGLDVKMPFGLQDIDFCIRASRHLGKKIYCLPISGIFHHESATRKNPTSLRNFFRTARDTVRFLVKNGPYKTSF